MKLMVNRKEYKLDKGVNEKCLSTFKLLAAKRNLVKAEDFDINAIKYARDDKKIGFGG